jgi:hypothetical protein
MFNNSDAWARHIFLALGAVFLLSSTGAVLAG